MLGSGKSLECTGAQLAALGRRGSGDADRGDDTQEDDEGAEKGAKGGGTGPHLSAQMTSHVPR